MLRSVPPRKDSLLFTFAGLYLEEPNRSVYSNAQRSAGFFKLLEGKFGEGDALSRANLLVDATRVSTARQKVRKYLPMNAHRVARAAPTMALAALTLCRSL